MKRFLGLSGIALLFVICLGCGDVFRPIIIPNPPTFPNPRAAHTVMSINQNTSDDQGTPQISPGSVTVVDVSGDSVSADANVGVVPVHAVQQTAGQVLVVNQGSTAAGADSLSKIVFSGTTVVVSNINPTTISLPQNSAPNFVATTESGQAYVLLPNFAPPSFAVVNTLSNNVTATVPVSANPVGANPVAMVETLDKNKLYIANQGNGTISAFNTVDRSARGITGSLSLPPVWLSARSDSQQVYVLESAADGSSSKLAFLNTSTTAGPDVLTETTLSIPAGATEMTYDVILNRLYIAAGTSAAVVDVSQTSPQLLATVTLTALPPSSRIPQDPCASGAPVTNLSAVAATALPDGSRAYIGAFYEDSLGNICPQVTVINTSSNTVKTTAAIPGFANFDAVCGPTKTRFRFAMAVAGDSSHAYMSACDGGNINIISTADDTFSGFVQAPASARPPASPGAQPPPQNPVFLIAGP